MSEPGSSARAKAGAALVAKRRADAIDLLIAGHRPTDIATMLGYKHVSQVSDDVTRALEANKEQLAASVDHLRAVEYMRLSAVIASAWEEMQEGSTRHADIVLKASSAIRELMGLNAPTKVELTTPVINAEIAEMEMELTRRGIDVSTIGLPALPAATPGGAES
jgi:hypothetical protein